MNSKTPKTILSLIWATALLGAGCVDPSLQTLDEETSSSRASQPPTPSFSKELRAAYIAAVQAQASDEYSARSFGDIKYLNNPAQRFSLTVDSKGLTLVPEGKTWHLALRTDAVGCSETEVPVAEPTLRSVGNRVHVERGELEEWYANGPLGVEQGFVLPKAPACSGLKTIRLAVEGDVTAALEDADGDGRGHSIRFVDADGQTQLSYSDLFVRDARGQTVPSWLSVQDGRPVIVVDDTDAVYPLAVDPLIWVQQQKLLASNGAAGDLFGNAVALAGDTAVIGAFNDDQQAQNAGAAYVFVRQGGVWTQEAKLVAQDAAADAHFGQAVAISGTTVLVGAFNDDDKGAGSGSAYVFVRQGNVWTQQAKLVAMDGVAFDSFGMAVSLVGDTAVVGAPYGDGAAVDSGTAYVFDRNGTTWTQQAKIAPADGLAYDDFGASVSLSSNTLLIGADSHDMNAPDSGAAYIYLRTGNTWNLEAKVAPGDGADSDYFGWASVLSGDTALIGAYGDDDKGSDAGSAYVYVRNGGVWTQQAKLLAADGSAGDVYGVSVALSGDTALVGATFDDPKGVNSGSAYIYQRNGSVWTEYSKIVPSDGAATDWFTYSVALSGDTALVGARYDDDKGSDAGSAYVFVLRNAPGDSCLAAADCATGFCVDGVCCDQACGGSDSTDCRACSIAAGAAVNGVCAAVAFGTVCRAATDVCDLAETCDGVADACPTDAKAAKSVVCRASAGACDVAEACDGMSDACPADVKMEASVVCRAAADVCDTAETCDGLSNGCPADAKAGTSVVCRAAADVCDTEETCDGTSNGCPADAKAGASVVCRAAGGACDIEEKCDGKTDVCPTDVKVAASVVCRAAGGVCDIEEKCDGMNDACPTDVKVDPSVVCRVSAGVCDVEETCDGKTNACPTDAKADAFVVCRPGGDVCNGPETCDGVSVECPSDITAPTGTPCPGGICTDGACVPDGTGGAGGTGETGGGGSTGEPPAGCACDMSSTRTSGPSALALFVALGAMVTRRRGHANMRRRGFWS